MEEILNGIRDLFNIGIFEVGDWYLDVRKAFFSILILFAAFVLNLFVGGRLLNYFKRKGTIEEPGRRRIRRIIRMILLMASLVGLLKVLDLDYLLYDIEGEHGTLHFRVSIILYAVMVLYLAQLVDWILARILVEKYFDNREKKEQAIQRKVIKPKDERSTANRTIQYVVYLVAAILILREFNLDHTFYTLKDGSAFTLSNIFSAILTIFIARLLVWVLTNIVLYQYYRSSNIDVGSQFAVNQILKYVIYVVALLIALQNNLGMNLDIILGGAAALMVGIGLGLQQTFNDLISGIILLFERTVEVGDVVEVDGLVGTITKIGIRTSVVLVRDNTSIVVPNSKFITENVINWSHNDDKVRFKLAIGVAYGSDTELVREILLKVAKENPDILQRPAPFIRFIEFADSSLNFELHFWSRNFIRIEDVKSDLRFQVDKEFRENNVEIPFPQRDIWQRS